MTNGNTSRCPSSIWFSRPTCVVLSECSGIRIDVLFSSQMIYWRVYKTSDRLYYAGHSSGRIFFLIPPRVRFRWKVASANIKLSTAVICIFQPKHRITVIFIIDYVSIYEKDEHLSVAINPCLISPVHKSGCVNPNYAFFTVWAVDLNVFGTSWTRRPHSIRVYILYI